MRKQTLLGFFCWILSFNLTADNTLKEVTEYHLLTISDIHLGMPHQMNMAPKGASIVNDMDLKSLQILLQASKQLLITAKINPQSILILGDLVDHFSSSFIGTVNRRITMLQLCFKSLLQTFAPIPLSYVFGNNDSLLGNYKTFYSDVNQNVHSPYEVAKQSGWQSGFLSTKSYCQSKPVSYPCLITGQEAIKEGYYVEYLAPKLLLIGMNSVLLSYVVECKEACKKELTWLKDQLQAAAQQKAMVLIALHIPPGGDIYKKRPFWNDTARQSFLKTIEPYSDCIMGVLTAHTHMEELQIIRFEGKSLIPVIFTAGFSTSHGNAPALKEIILAQDKIADKWYLKNTQTFYYSQGKFVFLYDFQSAFCAKEMTSISSCLSQLINAHKLHFMFSKLGTYYTAGNINFPLKVEDRDLSDILIK